MIESILKGRWGEIVQLFLESLPIVEKLYVFCDLPDGFLPCLEMALKDKFSLQGSPEAFHWGVVIAIPLTAHGCPHSEPVNQPTVLLGTILASTIRVVDQPGCRAFRCHSMEQRLVDQVLRHPGAHGIADYLSGVHVLVSGKIEPALIRRDIRIKSNRVRLVSSSARLRSVKL